MDVRTQLNVTVGDRISGEFIAKNPNSHVSQISRPYIVFDIRPELLPVKAIAWNDSCCGYRKIFHGQNIGLEGYWQSFNGKLQVKCTSITDLNRENQKIAKANTRLRALIACVPDNVLKKFILRVLNDKQIINDFTSAPASLNHHQAYYGGLLVHSVDAAWQVFSNHLIPSHERYLGTIVSLLHDIGKIRTMSSNMTRTELGNLVNHESLTLEILAPHLRWLDSVDSQLALSIRYLLTWKKKSYDPIPKLDVYEVISMADRISSGSSSISS